jgi:hypothetical protein
MPNQPPRWLNVLGVIALANFAAFLCATTYFGGDALNGYAANNHYFLYWKGAYTEVSRAIFIYSRVHVLSVLGTHALAIGGGLFTVGDRARGTVSKAG